MANTKNKNPYSVSNHKSKLPLILGGVAIIVVAAVVAFGVYWVNRKSDEAAYISLGANADAAAPVVEIFEDPLCPVCGEYEQSAGAKSLEQAIREKKVQARYRLLNFLNNGSSSKNYSTRADAMFLTLSKAPLSENDRLTLWLDTHSEAYKQGVQPQENGPDLSNDQLADIVAKVAARDSIKLPDTVLEDIKKGVNVKEAADAAQHNLALLRKRGAQGTPDIYYNGKMYAIEQGDSPESIASEKFVRETLKIPADNKPATSPGDQKPTAPQVAPPQNPSANPGANPPSGGSAQGGSAPEPPATTTVPSK